MPRLDMTAFSDLRNMSADRERAVSYARLRRNLEPGRSEVIVQFWEEVGQRLESQDDLEAMGRLVSELERDINLMQAIKDSQSGSHDDPQMNAQNSMVARMLRMLMDLLFAYRKRLAELKEQALRYFLMMNPAMPSKVLDKMEQDKAKSKGNKKPAGQAKAKKTVNEAPAAKGDTKAASKDKAQERPEKKMSP